MKTYEIQVLLASGYYINVLSAGPSAEEALADALRILKGVVYKNMIDETEITVREVEVNYVAPSPSLIPVPNDPKERMIFETERSGH